ncbi:hypothetical protein GDO81_030126 [Engystomops pustulosus]|uniref:Beta/gamma crystallin 'Greek key' domain-containing protein n=1 Tax=Engystomops pustulosus TaxID=76066 RepID=A0AAV6ZH17_ENGPU|nr:hypothetical protein GDO81_030126 [Engystomops pustulosus]
MSRIILYTGANCTGSSTSFTRNISAFTDHRTVMSIRVEGDAVWILYSEEHYKGDIAVFKQGEYKSLSANVKGVKSVRKLSGTLEDFSITVCEDSYFEGEQHNIKIAENLRLPYPIMSHQVNGGVWLLYDRPVYGGKHIVSVAEDSVTDETNVGLGQTVNSLKAYLTYETPN